MSMVITVGEHRIRPVHQCYTVEYRQHDKAGVPTDRWREAGYYPSSLQHGLERLMELELKRRGAGCAEAAQLLDAVRAMRAEIVSLASV
jgi:hypothetical protein